MRGRNAAKAFSEAKYLTTKIVTVIEAELLLQRVVVLFANPTTMAVFSVLNIAAHQVQMLSTQYPNFTGRQRRLPLPIYSFVIPLTHHMMQGCCNSNNNRHPLALPVRYFPSPVNPLRNKIIYRALPVNAPFGLRYLQKKQQTPFWLCQLEISPHQ